MKKIDPLKCIVSVQIELAALSGRAVSETSRSFGFRPDRTGCLVRRFGILYGEVFVVSVQIELAALLGRA